MWDNYIMNIKQFLGMPPHPATRAGVLPGTQKIEGEEGVTSRRDFLRGAGKLVVSTAVANLGISFLAEEVHAKDDVQAFANNQISKRKFVEFLNNKNIPHTLNNPKADGVSIYNDLEKIIKDWQAGEFQRNEAKYYKPKSVKNLNKLIEKYKGDEVKFLEEEGLRKFNLKADYLSVGEIQGANGEDFMTKGFVVLKKGTELYTRDINGVKQTYIAECFNRLYVGEPLCPPCPEGMCKK